MPFDVTLAAQLAIFVHYDLNGVNRIRGLVDGWVT
tara:strand:+ start:147 stop:251 length:105 start_codon:yes stop_codon:yes gene_type:complete